MELNLEEFILNNETILLGALIYKVCIHRDEESFILHGYVIPKKDYVKIIEQLSNELIERL